MGVEIKDVVCMYQQPNEAHCSVLLIGTKNTTEVRQYKY